MVQLDGAGTAETDRILIVGATNRPQELDEAARRRLVRRLYVPLPELPARVQIMQDLIKTEHNDLTDQQLEQIARKADGFSGADMKVLCHEASMGPIRSMATASFDMVNLNENDVRPVSYEDFCIALMNVRASVSQSDLQQYVEWNQKYGSGS